MKRKISSSAFILIALVLCPAGSALAQGGNSRIDRGAVIRGQVRLADGSTAPTGVMVVLESASLGYVMNTQTDSQGKFTLTANSMGIYVVKAKHVGYEEFSERVDMTITPTVFIEVKLKPVAGAPGAMPVTGTVPVGAFAVPDAAKKEFDKGRKLLLEDKQAEKSAASLNRAIEIYPKFTEAHILLGTAYMEMKKLPEARAALEKAVALDEKSGPAHLALGVCQAQQGDGAAAEKSLLRGTELSPDSLDGHLELAKLQWAQGKWQEAEPHVRKAIALKSDAAAAHVLLGNILLRKRDAKGALTEFQTYLKLDPSGPFAAGAKDMVARIEKALASNPQ